MDLFLDNVDLVKKIVNKLYYGFLNKDDLMQAGLMGLFYATKNYDPNHETKFNTYATYYIIGEIKKELRENKLIKFNKQMYRIIKFVKESNDISLEEASQTLNVDKETVFLAYTYMNKEASLNALKTNNSGEEIEYLEVIPDDKEKRSIIYEALDSLDKEDKEVITLRYFKNYSQIEVSKLLKKHQSKVSRLEHNALLKMRKYILN